MRHDSLDEQLRAFVLEHFDSVEQLEVLLFLREERSRTWAAEQVGHVLRSSSESITKRMRDLKARKFLSGGDGLPLHYKYDPMDAKLDEMVAQLAEAYKVKRFSIINLIFSRPEDALISFSEAFKIKKGGQDK